MKRPGRMGLCVQAVYCAVRLGLFLSTQGLQELAGHPDFRAHVGHIQEVGLLDFLGVGGTAVLQDHHAVVQGDGVVAGGTDAVWGSGTGKDEGICAQAAQEEVQGCLEESGVAGLDDLVVSIGFSELRGVLHGEGAGTAGGKGLAAPLPHCFSRVFHVAAVGAVGAVYENHRDAFCPAGGDSFRAGGDGGFCPFDAEGGFRIYEAVLHVDDN